VVRDNTTSAGINITGSGTPASTLTADIYGNIVTGCYKPGLNIDRQSNHGGTLRVCNNTFYDNNQRSGSWTGAGGEVMVHSDSDGMQVAFSNNLLAHHPGSGSRT
ncbi:MAG: hypothetical protein GWO24_12435, partial [Akkermansiaceae bacterium]|nr:hypothetical protein [Akkermansiaceae bacterium]